MSKKNEELELENKLKKYKKRLIEILGEEKAVKLINYLIPYEFGNRLIKLSQKELNEIDNKVEIAAAKQLPKDTDYNIIGVVNQYILAIRKFTDSADPTEKYKAFAKAQVCEDSIYANYSPENAERLISCAIQKDAVVAKLNGLKRVCDSEQENIKALTKGNKGAGLCGTIYTKTYFELDDLRKVNANCICVQKQDRGM